MKRATIKDVAALAGVSAATVSRVLDDRPEISAETKEKVREACRCLGYVPNAAARGLTGRRTNVIGMVIPDVSNPYFSGMVTAIERRAAQEGFRVMLSNSMRSEEQELRAIDHFLARQIDGLLVAAISPQSQARHGALIRGLPCVTTPPGPMRLPGIFWALAIGTSCFSGGGRPPAPGNSASRAFTGPWRRRV